MKFSLKDIPDKVILQQQQKWWEKNERNSNAWKKSGMPLFVWKDPEPNPFTYEAFPHWPEKLVYKKMEKLADQGYLEYGVSLRTAWLSEKGKKLLEEN